MKQYNLTLVVTGVLINYVFFEKEKRTAYLAEALDTGKVSYHEISEVEATDKPIVR